MVPKKKEIRPSMNDDRKKEINSQGDEYVTPLSSPDSSNPQEAPNRRELIERYGKYALVAAPLLLFASEGPRHS